MKLKKRLIQNDEIDLVYLVNIVWINKFKIFLSTSLPALFFYFLIISDDPVKEIYKTRTEIIPISTFMEYEYKIFNNYLDVKKKLANAQEKNSDFIFQDVEATFFFEIIDANYLMDLFVKRLTDEPFLIKAIKNSNFIEKEKFKNSKEYGDKIIETISKLKITPIIRNTTVNKWQIHFETDIPEKYLNFLEFLEKSVNIDIQKYLKKNFEDTILNQKVIQNYKIEDIDFEIELSEGIKNIENLEYLAELKKYKEKLLSDKSVERLQLKFNTTPIIKSEIFSASKIVVEQTEFQNINNVEKNILLQVISAGLVGMILSIFFVLISSRIKN